MEARATLGQSGRVAVLSLSCGAPGMPVADAVATALEAPQVAALVLRGAPEAFAQAATPALCDALAAAAVPVVAACAGALEDGAVELALAAAYRLATPATTFAFPGTGAGRLPEAGGVHRLVRRVGGARAALLLLHPRPIAAPEAERIGLVDGVAHGALEAASLSLARRLAGAAIGPRAAAPPEGGVACAPDPDFARRAPGAVATLQACLADSVLSPAEAPRLEAARIAAYGESGEAAALSHLARARAAVAPPPGAPEPVERIAVSGLAAVPGTLAPAFVHALARAGFDVRLADPLDALDAVRAGLPPGAPGWMRAAGPATEEADLALACTSEGMVARFAGGAALSLALAGPGPGVSLVEAVPATPGASGALRALGELCRRAGAVLVCHAPGGAPCAPVLRGALFEAAHRLLEDGWTPQALDGAAMAAGLPAGPCAQEDALGLGVGAAVRAAAAGRRDPRLRYVALADRLHAAGRGGRRAGAGFFRYAAPFAAPERDPRADAMIAEARRDAGRAPRPDLTASAAVGALIRSVQEAASAPAARGATGAVVDLVAVAAGVFPARLGGPVHARAAGGAGGADGRADGGAAAELSRGGRRP